MPQLDIIVFHTQSIFLLIYIIGLIFFLKFFFVYIVYFVKFFKKKNIFFFKKFKYLNSSYLIFCNFFFRSYKNSDKLSSLVDTYNLYNLHNKNINV